MIRPTIVYVLSNGYVGTTGNLPKRLRAHSKNRNKGATLVEYWFIKTHPSALILEYYLQKLPKDKLWELVLDCNQSIKFLLQEARSFVASRGPGSRNSWFYMELGGAKL